MIMLLTEDDCMVFPNYVLETNYETKDRFLPNTVIVGEVDYVVNVPRNDDLVFYGALNVSVYVQIVVQENYEVGEMYFMVDIASIAVDSMSVRVFVVVNTRNEHVAIEHLLQIVTNGIAIVNY